MPLFQSEFGIPKSQEPSVKAPNYNTQITNKSQIPKLNEQTF
jgi:hypothetical protein